MKSKIKWCNIANSLPWSCCEQNNTLQERLWEGQVQATITGSLLFPDHIFQSQWSHFPIKLITSPKLCGSKFVFGPILGSCWQKQRDESHYWLGVRAAAGYKLIEMIVTWDLEANIKYCIVSYGFEKGKVWPYLGLPVGQVQRLVLWTTEPWNISDNQWKANWKTVFRWSH